MVLNIGHLRKIDTCPLVSLQDTNINTQQQSTTMTTIKNTFPLLSLFCPLKNLDPIPTDITKEEKEETKRCVERVKSRETQREREIV